jgi:hypothetical protein
MSPVLMGRPVGHKASMASLDLDVKPSHYLMLPSLAVE